MTPVFRIVLIVVSLLSTYYILKKIRQSKLQIEYAIFWIVFARACWLSSACSRGL